LDVARWLALSREGLSHGWVWQLVTFQFLHGGFLHLLCNMIGLYFFGQSLERMIGSRALVKLYLVSGMAGGLVQMGLAFAWPSHFGSAVVGASAGVFGLVAAFALSCPNEPVGVFPFPISFPAKYLLIFEGVLTLTGVLLPSPSGIAHGAHLGGLLMGLAFIYWNLARFEFRWPERQRKIIRPAQSAWKSSRRQPVVDVPETQFISQEVDPILDKISARGIHSLTDKEREILEKARSRMARK
jgi:membrane associated rhomboid family serine protease